MKTYCASITAVTAALCCCGIAQAKTPRETGLWLASEKDKWAKVVKEAGLKVE